MTASWALLVTGWTCLFAGVTAASLPLIVAGTVLNFGAVVVGVRALRSL